MNIYTLRITILSACIWGCLIASSQQRERFAGLHLDFHAGASDSGIGKTFTFEMIDSMMRIIQPDFIQVDCKGHPGISSYPTKVGNAAPAFAKDIMKIWREVTARYKVPLYAHYSGIWDNQALRLHPHWARYTADGKPHENATSLFSAYADSLLIPQLKELAVDYKLDGIWVDGDCWVLGTDYAPAAKAAFTKATGISAIPQKPGEPHFFEWMEFHRKAFRDYITKYANAVHKVAPQFKVTSNWSFSSMMPEPVNIPVDYLSGDVAGSNSLYSSAFESRCLALQGKPWDLMSWSFAWKNNSKATKSVAQLQQEAAEVLAQGGGFQTYWQQNNDGSPEPYQFRKMAEIIRFCNERKAYTFKGQSVPQIGLLYATYAWKRYETNSLYTAHHQEALKGVLNILLDSRLPVDILMDHQLPGKLQQYPVLVIPEWEHIDPSIRIQLIEYVNNGGNLLVIGANAVKDFKNELGIHITDATKQQTGLFAGFNNRIVLAHTDFLPVAASASAIKKGIQLTADDWRFATGNCLASVQPYGKGKIAGIYMNMGNFYNGNQNPLFRELATDVIKEMVPSFLSVVEGSEKIHQVITRKNGRLYIHLINTGGPHNNPNVLVYDEVAALKKIQVKVALPKKPAAVLLQPGNIAAEQHYANGKLDITIPELNIYSIIEISE
ncbi:MAG: hypothetical protein KF862_26195 [Chitinophagaceae bacterium]|nr:hypothetical protein [Chitinophagaceae bacterium]